ncbi:ArsR/SmtB family transcription factor [Agromyces atrinae]|uniref:ArsR family transcriptional regulator n=1 Tax=Agromyces atrinae TaxID=592376 RepID=A0A4Q2M734_9MICO|nr:helix-turn-helix domain-containing protein [Agromyces atrinae]NYD68736.1 DNA-binding transcriptional ArsR family regulator [Agromyces atrinae]RXZ86093.1 ArsR family transcriptional regulator [Agromyces atrinae]
MASRERITDPERIRALAHPIRLELLDFLGGGREATATECAAHVGESVANCSFHLRTLEKYGYIERAERRGREKPWRAVVGEVDLRPDPELPGSFRAVQELAILNVDRESERLRSFYAHADLETDEWVQATTLTRAEFWATVDELAELSREIQSLAARFAGRAENPELRPPGARRAHLLGSVLPAELGSVPAEGERPVADDAPRS